MNRAVPTIGYRNEPPAMLPPNENKLPDKPTFSPLVPKPQLGAGSTDEVAYGSGNRGALFLHTINKKQSIGVTKTVYVKTYQSPTVQALSGLPTEPSASFAPNTPQTDDTQPTESFTDQLTSFISNPAFLAIAGIAIFFMLKKRRK